MNWKKTLLEQINSHNPEKDWEFLLNLQKEQAPWLSKKEIEECVVLSVIREYDCSKLDWEYFTSHIDQGKSHTSKAA